MASGPRSVPTTTRSVPLEKHLRELADADPGAASELLPRASIHESRARRAGAPTESARDAAPRDERRQQLRHHPAGRERVEARAGERQCDSRGRAGGPRRELNGAQEGEVLQPLQERGEHAQRKRHARTPPPRSRTARRSGSHSAGNSHTAAAAASATSGVCQATRAIVRPIATPTSAANRRPSAPCRRALPRRERHFARHQGHHAEIHQRQVNEHLRREQPQPVVVRAELPQQERREPQTDDQHGKRVQVAQSEAAGEAGEAPLSHARSPPDL